MKFVSLFAGIGGIDLGLERAGHECVGQVEIDDYATRVLEKHWPNTPRIRDVRDFQGHEFGHFDMLVGGYPCQPFSVAGSRKGERDERHLWPEVLRILRNVRPKYLFVENVTGHLSLGFGRVLGDLAESGYDAEWDCIPAAAVGANHRRDRVFIIARRRTEELADTDGVGRVHGQVEQYAADIREYAQRDVAASCANVADTDEQRPDSGEAHGVSKSVRDELGNCEESERGRYEQQLGIASGRANVANASGERREKGDIATSGSRKTLNTRSTEKTRSHWAIEPNVGRTLDGFSTFLDRLDLSESHASYLAYANAKKERPNQILSTLRSIIDSPQTGRYASVQASEVLLAYLRKLEEWETDKARIQLEGKKIPENQVRSLPAKHKLARSPHRPRHNEQRPEQYPDTMQALSQLLARHAEKAWLEYRRSDAYAGGWEDGVARVAQDVSSRTHRLRALGNAVVPQVAEWIGWRLPL